MASFGRKGNADVVDAPEENPIAPVLVATVGASQVAAFPRVNLIPDEIAEEARVRRAKIVVIGAVAASVVAAGGLYMMAVGEVGAAQQELDSTTALSASLAAEVTKYADVPRVRADLASAKNQQALAMGGEVRWSFVLNNLALTIPQGTAITSFKGSITGVAPGTGSTPNGGIVSVLGQPGIGAVTFEGEALDNAKVAAFLESIAKNNGVLDPFATQATKDGGGDASTDGPVAPVSIKFSATTTIGPKALSHRYDVKGG